MVTGVLSYGEVSRKGTLYLLTPDCNTVDTLSVGNTVTLAV